MFQASSGGDWLETMAGRIGIVVQQYFEKTATPGSALSGRLLFRRQVP